MSQPPEVDQSPELSPPIDPSLWPVGDVLNRLRKRDDWQDELSADASADRSDPDAYFSIGG